MTRQITAINDRLIRVAVFFSNTWHLVAAGVAFICFQVFILPSFLDQILSLSGGTMILDLSFWYSPGETLRRLGAYGAEGRKLYIIAEWTADLVYPAVYAICFAAWMHRLGAGRWVLLPIFSALIDWMENVAVTAMLLIYPQFSPLLAMTSGVLTACKWVLVGSSILIILGLLGKWMVGRLVGG